MASTHAAMYRNILLTTAITFALPLCAQATGGTTAPSTAASGPDTSFVQQAGQGGLAEVELSKLAASKASSKQVRDFAEHMVKDHTQNNAQLATIASRENIAVPKDLDSQHMQLRDRLSSMSGDEFDRLYVDSMREDHQKMLDMLKSSEASVSNNDLRTFIKKTEPVVQHHLSMAQTLAPKLK